MTQWISTDKIQPRPDLLLVKRYAKPEKVGSLYLPDEWRDDRSGMLWEFVKAGREVFRTLGIKIPLGSIIKTRPGKVVDSGLLDEIDNKQLFFLKAEDCSQILPNTWG
jgi:hypothetical protein